MKTIKWKILTLTCLVCLSPILLGLFLYDSLPEEIAIHFDIYGTPDNFASKNFAVFGLPILMVLLQIFCCVINDVNAARHGERKKFSLATKWIIPILTVVLQIVTFGFALGWNLNIRKITALLVGIIFLVVGNFLPKFGVVKDENTDMEKVLKINRMIAYGSVVMGLLFLLSIFLPPVFTIFCLILLIPYAVFSVIYGIKIGRK